MKSNGSHHQQQEIGDNEDADEDYDDDDEIDEDDCGDEGDDELLLQQLTAVDSMYNNNNNNSEDVDNNELQRCLDALDDNDGDDEDVNEQVPFIDEICLLRDYHPIDDNNNNCGGSVVGDGCGGGVGDSSSCGSPDDYKVDGDNNVTSPQLHIDNDVLQISPSFAIQQSIVVDLATDDHFHLLHPNRHHDHHQQDINHLSSASIISSLSSSSSDGSNSLLFSSAAAYFDSFNGCDVGSAVANEDNENELLSNSFFKIETVRYSF